MSGRRGLLSDSRRTAGSAAPRQRAAAPRSRGPVELPPYEEPECPLTEAAVTSLTAMRNDRLTTRKYDEHLGKCLGSLTESIYAINERRQQRKSDLEALATQRQEKGIEKTDREMEVEEAVEQLDNDVPTLSTQIESSFRQVLDRQVESDNDKDAVKDMAAQAAQRLQQSRPRRRPVGDIEDDEDAAMDEAPEAPVTCARDLLQNARRAKAAGYDGRSAYEKYALHNEYANFKKSWHDAEHEDDGAVLPDASTWFDREGRPAILRTDSNGDADDDDADLVVQREVVSFKCPLSLRIMEQPFSNKRCKHSFEKAAILEFLQRGPLQCPQTGCSQLLSTRDFYLDEALLRKIQRAEKAAKRNAGDTSDIEPDDADASMVEARSRRVKKEKFVRSRQVAVDGDEDE